MLKENMVEEREMRFSTKRIIAYALLVSVICLTGDVDLLAQRVSTFPQVDHPHDYYFKELYLPQLTSGPSSLCWTPDGHELIFSMAGSLWRQRVESDTAFQLTDDEGYDYQPDCSPDGKKIVFTRYNGRSLELMLLDLESIRLTKLTQNNGVNVEPRWSPSGKEIVFVSTMNTGHYLTYKAAINSTGLVDITCVTPDRESKIERYYYGSWDHAISPFWSQDGEFIYFISNREVAHGSGNLFKTSIDDLNQWELIREEETSWRARPDISPDNSRIVSGSYFGRNWHQLWLLPSEGGYPFPLTYGDYDNSAPRWSPDGNSIAFISNRTGNTSVWLVDAFDGGQKPLITSVRQFIQPKHLLNLKIVDKQGALLPARLSVVGSRGQFFAPEDAWIHGDDSYYEGQKFEYHYFHSEGQASVKVPADSIFIDISHGLLFERRKLKINASNLSASDTLKVVLDSLNLPTDFGSWWSGDLHIHMNYGGNYRNTPEILIKQGQAEDLNFLYNLIVNKEQRVPDVAYFSTNPDQVSTSQTILLHAQEYHTSFWGHLGILNLQSHLLLPDYAAYPYTAVSSIFPHNSFVADRAHQQGALVGYVHPFLDVEIFPEQSASLKNELPLDAALGKVDYYELVGFAHHRASERVWYQLLNCGLKIAAGAGTDAMANYASLRGPVGLNRVYVKAEGDFNQDNFIRELKDGRGFVTNGPILKLSVNELGPGDTLNTDEEHVNLNYNLLLESATDIENLELVWNGEVVKKIEIKNNRSAREEGKLNLEGPGWLLLRAWNQDADPEIMDYYPYASTNPIYILPPDSEIKSKSGGAYFLPWIGRIEKAVQENHSFRSEKEKINILNDIDQAKKFYQDCVDQATIP